MNFADQLRQQAVQKVSEEQEKERRELEAAENAKKEFYSKRHEAILSGEAVASFYAGFKLKLLEVAKFCLDDGSKSFNRPFIYLSEELSQKEAHYWEARKERTEYYVEKMGHCPAAEENARKSLMSLYFDIRSCHKAFSEEECDIIEQQIEASFSKDGLRCLFQRRKANRFRYEPREQGRWKKCQEGTMGYTLDITATWYPWDTSKDISYECLEKIKRACLDWKEEHPLCKIKRPKLLANLGLENAEVYLYDDATLFGSGKEGYAITPEGIFTIENGHVHKYFFREMADNIGPSNTIYTLDDADEDIFSRITKIVRADLM